MVDYGLHVCDNTEVGIVQQCSNRNTTNSTLSTQSKGDYRKAECTAVNIYEKLQYTYCYVICCLYIVVLVLGRICSVVRHPCKVFTMDTKIMLHGGEHLLHAWLLQASEACDNSMNIIIHYHEKYNIYNVHNEYIK